MSPTSTEGDAVDVGPDAASISSDADRDATPDAPTTVSASPEDAISTKTGELSGETAGAADFSAEQDPSAESFTDELVAQPDELVAGPADGGEPEVIVAAEDESSELAEPAFLDDLESESSGDVEEDYLSPPEMAQMLFVEVVLQLPATHPVVVLQEADAPFREVRIPIGGAEGIAIGYAARGIETPRPLTHELFTRVLEEFGMTIDVVRLTDVNGASFTAEIVVSGPQGVREIDCRPSDAIALALRQRLPVPIVASPIVLAIAGTDPLGAN